MVEEELKSKIRAFMKSDYPNVGEHLSLKSCLETITGNSNTRIILEDGKPFVMIGKRKFELTDLYCPDLKETNAFLFDELAVLEFTQGKYVIDYCFLHDSEVSHIEIYEEDEKGYIEMKGKKYKTKDIIGCEKIKEGISIEI